MIACYENICRTRRFTGLHESAGLYQNYSSFLDMHKFCVSVEDMAELHQLQRSFELNFTGFTLDLKWIWGHNKGLYSQYYMLTAYLIIILPPPNEVENILYLLVFFFLLLLIFRLMPVLSTEVLRNLAH